MLEGRFFDRDLGLGYVAARLAGGLPAYVFPRPGFARRLALLAVGLGSADDRLALAGEPALELPDGAAHFLEHQVFDGPRGNALARFASRGASVNAYTAPTHTAYFFTGTGEFDANLADLLGFVREPALTAAGVAKERPIIAQEIRMYEDLPAWRIHFALLRGLYHAHPVRRNPAGSEESLARIDERLLGRLHRGCYGPGNMIFVAAGDLEPEAVFRQVEEELGPRGGAPPPEPAPARPPHPEPPGIAAPRQSERLLLSRPRLALGFKERPGFAGEARLRRSAALEVLLEVFLGEASPLRRRLYRRGLIDDSFSCGHCGEEDFGFTIISAETGQPELLARELAAGLERAAARPLPAAALERARRQARGGFALLFDRVEAIGRSVLAAAQRGCDLLAWPRLVGELGAGELQELAREHFDPARRALAVLEPQTPPPGRVFV